MRYGYLTWEEGICGLYAVILHEREQDGGWGVLRLLAIEDSAQAEVAGILVDLDGLRASLCQIPRRRDVFARCLDQGEPSVLVAVKVRAQHRQGQRKLGLEGKCAQCYCMPQWRHAFTFVFFHIDFFERLSLNSLLYGFQSYSGSIVGNPFLCHKKCASLEIFNYKHQN